MRILLFILFITLCYSKEAEVKNHSINEISSNFERVDVKLKTESKSKHPTKYKYTVSYFNEQYGYCYYRKTYDYEVKKSSFEKNKSFIISNHCYCCEPSLLKYPNENKSSARDSVFSISFMMNGGIVILSFLIMIYILSFGYVCYKYLQDKSIQDEPIIPFSSMLFLTTVCAFYISTLLKISQAHTPSNNDIYILQYIEMKNKKIYGLYASLDRIYKVFFCEGDKDLLACGYVKQYDELSYKIDVVDENTYDATNYKSINLASWWFDFTMIWIIVGISVFILCILYVIAQNYDKKHTYVKTDIDDDDDL